MSEKYIPEHIDPFRFADQKLHLSGVMKSAEMLRISPELNQGDGPVHVDLQFGVDEQGVTFIKGSLKTTLVLPCQRCLEPYNYEIIASFLLGVVKSLDEADALPERYEPVLSKNGEVALRELIEDEVILNLPIIPRHAVDECQSKALFTDKEITEKEREQNKTANPFQVLASLKGKLKH